MSALAINPRLSKELKPLVLPGVVAMAALLIVMTWFNRDGHYESSIWVEESKTGLGLAFVLGATFLAARAFAGEYRNRTLEFWLSQPAGRIALLGDKFRGLAVPLAGLSALFLFACAQSQQHAIWLRFGVPCLLAVAASIVAAPVWAASARTTIGTFVFVLGSELFTLLAYLQVVSVLEKHFAMTYGGKIAGAIVVYALYLSLFGYLAWWGTINREATQPRSLGWNGDLRTLAFASPSRRGAIRNLIRKEFHLHRGSMVLAVVFVGVLVCLGGTIWLGSPAVRHLAVKLSPVPFFVYVVVLTLLSGATSMAEERGLKTHSWMLTQPVGARIQFRVKFGVSLFMFLVFAIGLPVVTHLGLEGLFPGPLISSYTDLHPRGLGPLELARNLSLGIFGVGFLLCFWISTMTSSLDRIGLSALAGLAALIATGIGTFSLLYSTFSATSYPGQSVAAMLWFIKLPELLRAAIFVGIFLVPILTLLVLSFRNFCSSAFLAKQATVEALFLAGVILLTMLVVEFLGTLDNRLILVVNQFNFHLAGEIRQAVNALEARSPNHTLNHSYTWSDLESTGFIEHSTSELYAHTGQKFSIGEGDFPLRRFKYVQLEPGLKPPAPFDATIRRVYLDIDSFTQQKGR